MWIMTSEVNWISKMKLIHYGAFIFTIGVVFVAIFTINAHANAYDNCILKYIANTKSRAAAYSIQRACISTVSKELPLQDTKSLKATAYAGYFNSIFGRSKPGIVIQLHNYTNYDISQINVEIENKKSKRAYEYSVREFFAPDLPGTLSSGLGIPELQDIIKTNARREFVIPVSNKIKIKEFSKTYKWIIYDAYGFIDK